MRLADFVVKFLEKKGIKTVFTVSEVALYFYVMLYHESKIKYISHHHEQAASLLQKAMLGLKMM